MLGTRDFNNLKTRAVIKFLFIFLKGKAPKEIHAILTETLTFFLPRRAKDLSAPLYKLAYRLVVLKFITSCGYSVVFSNFCNLCIWLT